MNSTSSGKKIGTNCFKSLVGKLLVIVLLLGASHLDVYSQTIEMNYPVKDEVRWFTDSRFGMFIHWTPLGAIDEEMTTRSFIVPGLGDAGDLAYGEK